MGAHGPLHKLHLLSPGTVVQENIAGAVKMFKGSREFKSDKHGYVNMAVGLVCVDMHCYIKIVIGLYVTVVTMVRSVLIRHGITVVTTL